MIHFEACPVYNQYVKGEEDCRCVDIEFYLEHAFEPEDVEHIDMMIALEMEDSGLLALPGLEWVRNMIAARVGVDLKPLGQEK